MKYLDIIEFRRSSPDESTVKGTSEILSRLDLDVKKVHKLVDEKRSLEEVSEQEIERLIKSLDAIKILWRLAKKMGISIGYHYNNEEYRYTEEKQLLEIPSRSKLRDFITTNLNNPQFFRRYTQLRNKLLSYRERQQKLLLELEEQEQLLKSLLQ